MGAITQIRDWAQRAVEKNTNRDIWELARLLQRPQAAETGKSLQEPQRREAALNWGQQDTLKTIDEQIAEKARLSKQLEDEALAAQRERDELVAQSDKNREFLELREHMLKLVGMVGKQAAALKLYYIIILIKIYLPTLVCLKIKLDINRILL